MARVYLKPEGISFVVKYVVYIAIRAVLSVSFALLQAGSGLYREISLTSYQESFTNTRVQLQVESDVYFLHVKGKRVNLTNFPNQI